MKNIEIYNVRPIDYADRCVDISIKNQGSLFIKAAIVEVFSFLPEGTIDIIVQGTHFAIKKQHKQTIVFCISCSEKSTFLGIVNGEECKFLSYPYCLTFYSTHLVIDLGKGKLEKWYGRGGGACGSG